MAAKKKPTGKKIQDPQPKDGRINKAASASTLNKKDIKFGLQARAEASKRGTPSGATNAGSVGSGKAGTRYQTSQTIVTSKRGNMYSIDKDKEVRRFRPDKTKTTISQFQTAAQTRELAADKIAAAKKAAAKKKK
jgi:hypothetical protein